MGSNYLSHTAWFAHTSVRLSQSPGQWYLFSFPSGSLSFINVLICLPVLSPHLDQFPPFADLVAAKHSAFTLMRRRIGHVKQLSDRRVQIYSNYTFWLLPLASSRFYFAAGACPCSKDIFSLNFLVIGNLYRLALTNFKPSEMALVTFLDRATVAIYLLNFLV